MKKIAALNVTMSGSDDRTLMEGRIEFDGDRDDMVAFLAHIFHALELEPAETCGLCLEAIQTLQTFIEEDNA